jgi:hypothetical protein
MPFIAGTNRHQTYFSTLEEQVATNNTVRLADAFLAALNAKKTNAACKALYDRLVEKGKNKKLAIIAVCNKLLKQVFAVVKSGVLYQDDYFKKLA